MTHDHVMSCSTPNLKICERCYSRIEDDDAFVALAHIAAVGEDGMPLWRFAYVHAAVAGGPAVSRTVPCMALDGPDA